MKALPRTKTRLANSINNVLPRDALITRGSTVLVPYRIAALAHSHFGYAGNILPGFIMSCGSSADSQLFAR